MRILAFTDTHGSPKYHKIIEKKSRNVDMIICAGDVSIFENDIDSIMHFFNSMGKPFYLIHGNHEEATVLRFLAKEFEHITIFHKRIIQLPELQLIGYGGGGFSMTDKEFVEFTKKIKMKLKKDKFSIMVTHAPPKDTVCDLVMKEHCGNRSYKTFLNKGKFDYWLCGHIHECSGKKEQIKKTTLLNPGPAGRILTIK